MLDRVLRIDEVSELVGLSRTTIYRLMLSGDFPKNFKLGERSSGWLLSQINQWLQERVETSHRNGGESK